MADPYDSRATCASSMIPRCRGVTAAPREVLARAMRRASLMSCTPVVNTMTVMACVWSCIPCCAVDARDGAAVQRGATTRCLHRCIGCTAGKRIVNVSTASVLQCCVLQVEVVRLNMSTMVCTLIAPNTLRWLQITRTMGWTASCRAQRPAWQVPPVRCPWRKCMHHTVSHSVQVDWHHAARQPRAGPPCRPPDQ